MVETAWLTAEQVMTSPAEVVAAEAPVLYAVGVLDRSGFSQLPVVNAEGLVVGTFRARDVRRLYWQLGQMLAADGGDVATELARRQVGQMCSEPLPQVRPDAGLSEVIARVEKWHAVLVGPMDKRWGIITSGDLLRISKPYLLLAELEVRLRHFIELQLSRLFRRTCNTVANSGKWRFSAKPRPPWPTRTLPCWLFAAFQIIWRSSWSEITGPTSS